jgi:hypothetical protein
MSFSDLVRWLRAVITIGFALLLLSIFCYLISISNISIFDFSYSTEEGTDSASTAALDWKPEQPSYTIDDLLDAIEYIESKGDPFAIGDDGEAVGAYQLHKIYIDDVNRICKIKKFDYSDRSNKKISRLITKIYLNYYGGTIEEMARKHNGGPNGHKKESTKKYWYKIKQKLEENAKLSTEISMQ